MLQIGKCILSFIISGLHGRRTIALFVDSPNGLWWIVLFPSNLSPCLELICKTPYLPYVRALLDELQYGGKILGIEGLKKISIHRMNVSVTPRRNSTIDETNQK